MHNSPDVDETVEVFVDRHVEEGKDTLSLSELWDRYRTLVVGKPVPRERFKWHLSKAMPDSVDREFSTFEGVEYVGP